MFNFILAVGILMLCPSLSNAQSSSTLIGARASSMGYASSCLYDEWSLFNNVAGLANIKEVSVGVAYDAYPSFQPFNKTAAVIALPFKVGVVGVGVFRFGDKLYNEQILSAGFSNTFGLASLGLKVNYIQYNAEGFGRKGVISISCGGIAKLTEEISIGAHIANLNQPKLSSIEDEKLPTILLLGIACKLSDKTLISTELEKDFDYPVVWKTGFEYQVHKKFLVRTGFNINPHAGFIGFGFRPKKFTLDYAYQYNFDLGPRHQATVGYVFKRREK